MQAVHAKLMSLAGKMLKGLGDGVAPAIDLIYPPRCPLCGDSIGRHGGLCAVCWSELSIPGSPACEACGRPFESGTLEDGAICAPCLAKPPKHDGITAATIYNDASRGLILAFKHGGRMALANMMARQIVSRLPDLPETTLLIPVPLHRWRLWHRGYNQSALLAREIVKQVRRPIAVDGLQRIRPTRSLGGLGRKDRRAVLKGAIRVNSRWRNRIEDRDIVLVDDVLTSGATTDVCVKVLKAAGAKSVRVACFARVMTERV